MELKCREWRGGVLCHKTERGIDLNEKSTFQTNGERADFGFSFRFRAILSSYLNGDNGATQTPVPRQSFNKKKL